MNRLLQWLRALPIGGKLILLVFLSSAGGLLLSAGTLMTYSWASSRAAVARDLRSVAQLVANNLTAAVAFNDDYAALDLLSALRARAEIELVCLYTDNGISARTLLAQYSPTGLPCPGQPLGLGLHTTGAQLVLVTEVRQSVERIGLLQMHQSLNPLRHALINQFGITLAILGTSLLVSLAIGWSLQRRLTAPILQLSQVARRVKETGNYRLRVRSPASDEVGELVHAFNDMIAQVGLREQALESARAHLANEVQEKAHANSELAAALENLKRTQMQLVQAERLASLGALVAGIAHEINTPVGVSVTAASTLCHRVEEARAQYDDKKLTRRMLESFMEESIQYSHILLRNLQRAADLVQSFKRIAVDQSSGERRRFELRGYVEEILLSLQPRLKKTELMVQLECEDQIHLDSYPGALAQILGNLVGNSLMHAYEEPAKGHLLIRVTRNGDRVSLRYVDDGRGIAPEHLSHIFDPFFTTRRNAGGSGLGLHIVHNLVTQLLGGMIEVHSRPGQGTEFALYFPIVAPVPRRALAASPSLGLVEGTS